MTGSYESLGTAASAGKAILMMLPLCAGIAGSLPAPQLPAAEVFPSPGYYLAQSVLYQGHFARALELFHLESQSALRGPTGLWIDSICYHTMIGECHWHLGNLSAALESFDAAARVYLAHRHWPLLVRFPPELMKGPGERIASPWGQSQRGTVPALVPGPHLPVALPALAGLRRGVLDGVGDVVIVDQMPHVLVDVSEVVRCMALMTRRRGQLLGPSAQHDPLMDQLREAYQEQPFPKGHWSQSWGQLLLGLSYHQQRQPRLARPLLEQAALMGGRFDHDLCGTALLTLGEMDTQAQNWAAAVRMFREASYAAFFYGDPITLTEALHQMAVAHRLSGAAEPDRALSQALGWVPGARWRPPVLIHFLQERQLSLLHGKDVLLDFPLHDLHVRFLLTEAEQQLRYRRPARAVRHLEKARVLIGGEHLDDAAIRARSEFLRAVAAYQKGQPDVGDEALGRALDIQSQVSPRAFHITVADQLAWRQEGPKPRLADALYPQVLGDPAPSDWLLDPLDLLSRASWPTLEAMEHWYQILWTEGRYGDAWEVAEEIRRQRFLSQLPFGGRLLAMQWLLQAPESRLSDPQLLQRTGVLARYPEFGKLWDQWVAAREDLRRLAFQRGGPQTQRQQEQVLSRLSLLDQDRNGLLREIATSPEPAEIPFPPRLGLREVQERLPPGQCLCSFLVISGRVDAFLVTSEAFEAWSVGPVHQVTQDIGELLLALGNGHGTRPVPAHRLQQPQWRDRSEAMWRRLFGQVRARRVAEARELIVVPDGALWLVPFEVLGAEADPEPDGITGLISHAAVRYAPTAALAMSSNPARPLDLTTLVVLPQRRPAAWSQRLLEDMEGQLSGVVHVPDASSARRVPAWMIGRLMVLEESSLPQDPWSWSPAASLPEALTDFAEHPWNGATEVILPVLRTPAESALQEADAHTAGQTLFIATMGLMANGVRTALLSRWQVGGQSARQLLREFLEELPHSSASEAWQRSVLLAATQRLSPEQEPRLQVGPKQPIPSASHPFFWSGYLLIDAGP